MPIGNGMGNWNCEKRKSLESGLKPPFRAVGESSQDLDRNVKRASSRAVVRCSATGDPRIGWVGLGLRL